MSKNNRRKSLKPQKESVIRKSDFSMENSKIYIILTIVVFHIIPLIFIMMGKNGKMILALMYPTVNPIFLGLAGLIYGMKEGFNFKFPAIIFILATLSVIMYGKFEGEMAVILGITYLVFSFISTVIGGILSKLFQL